MGAVGLDVRMAGAEGVERYIVRDLADREQLVAEHGFSALVTVRSGGDRSSILYDAGLIHYARSGAGWGPDPTIWDEQNVTGDANRCRLSGAIAPTGRHRLRRRAGCGSALPGGRYAVASAGRRSTHGLAASSCAASASSVDSSAGRPASWTASGNPSSPWNSGTEIAGWPVTLNVAV
jgi:hypothetical protein